MIDIIKRHKFITATVVLFLVVVAYLVATLYITPHITGLPTCIQLLRSGDNGYCVGLDWKVYKIYHCPSGPEVVDPGLCPGTTLFEVGRYSKGLNY